MTDKPVKHPSFGWATKEEIMRIDAMKIGPTRDKLLKEIAKRGKVKKK